MTTALTVINNAATLLQDSTFARWSSTELLAYLNDGQRELVTYKPSAYTLTANFQLAAGTRQALPAGGLILVDVVRNRGVAGATNGISITQVPRELLDAQDSSWHADVGVSVKNYMYSAKTPDIFYVYPAAAAYYVEIKYGATPTFLNSTGESLVVNDIYVPALTYYLLFRAFSKDAEVAANAQAAAAYYQLFVSLLGAKAASEMSGSAAIGGAK